MSQILPWVDAKRVVPRPTIHPEPATVEREYIGRTRLFREGDERSIREIHGKVAILFQQLAGSLEGLPRLGDERGAASEEEVQHGRGSPAEVRQEGHRFGQDGLRRQKVTGESLDILGARCMLRVIGVEERDERTGVQKAPNGGHAAPSGDIHGSSRGPWNLRRRHR